MISPLLLLSAFATEAAASSLYRWEDGEGVAHFTNAPTDGRFRRVGALSGTAQGWLRMPEAVRTRYSEEIREMAARHGVAPDLVESVIRVESAFNPRAEPPRRPPTRTGSPSSRAGSRAARPSSSSNRTPSGTTAA